jgi:hypothetical protein
MIGAAFHPHAALRLRAEAATLSARGGEFGASFVPDFVLCLFGEFSTFVTQRMETNLMFRNKTMAGLTILGLLTVIAAPVQAQVIIQPIPPHLPHEVQFRQLNWKVAVFANPAQAQAFAQTKANKGYQVVEEVLPGQVQVRFRMSHWHTYAVVPHGPEAHQIARSLQAKGLEARVIH